MRPEKWLEIAGYLMWIVVGVSPILQIASGNFGDGRPGVWIVAFLVFGLAFALMCSNRWLGLRSRVWLLVAQTAATLTMLMAGGEAMPAGLLVMVAGQLLWAVSMRVAAAWVAVQSIALFVIGLRFGNLVEDIVISGAFTGFQVFALATSSLAFSERHAREALGAANAELHATRELLSEASRASERLRISRDLHDTLGHHLTALSLQLDVASRTSEGKAADHLREAHAITRLLLSDVRDVVSDLREKSRVDLSEAIRTLTLAPSSIAIHLDVAPSLEVHDHERAQALLRCVQEIITNAARHAHARNLWIRLEQREGGIVLRARDDGHGAVQLRPGHGLTGMRERFEALEGSIEFESNSEAGFEVRGFMPRAALS